LDFVVFLKNKRPDSKPNRIFIVFEKKNLSRSPIRSLTGHTLLADYVVAGGVSAVEYVSESAAA